MLGPKGFQNFFELESRLRTWIYMTATEAEEVFWLSDSRPKEGGGGDSNLNIPTEQGIRNDWANKNEDGLNFPPFA